MVIKLSDDCHAEYVNLMNLFFTAQKLVGFSKSRWIFTTRNARFAECVHWRLRPGSRFEPFSASKPANELNSRVDEMCRAATSPVELTISFSVRRQCCSSCWYMVVRFRRAPLPAQLCCFQNVFLCSTEHRSGALLQKSTGVDYRPSCSCHNKLVSIGWVCSVCLSST